MKQVNVYANKLIAQKDLENNYNIFKHKKSKANITQGRYSQQKQERPRSATGASKKSYLLEQKKESIQKNFQHLKEKLVQIHRQPSREFIRMQDEFYKNARTSFKQQELLESKRQQKLVFIDDQNQKIVNRILNQKSFYTKKELHQPKQLKSQIFLQTPKSQLQKKETLKQVLSKTGIFSKGQQQNGILIKDVLNLGKTQNLNTPKQQKKDMNDLFQIGIFGNKFNMKTSLTQICIRDRLSVKNQDCKKFFKQSVAETSFDNQIKDLILNIDMQTNEENQINVQSSFKRPKRIQKKQNPEFQKNKNTIIDKLLNNLDFNKDEQKIMQLSTTKEFQEVAKSKNQTYKVDNNQLNIIRFQNPQPFDNLELKQLYHLDQFKQPVFKKSDPNIHQQLNIQQIIDDRNNKELQISDRTSNNSYQEQQQQIKYEINDTQQQDIENEQQFELNNNINNNYQQEEQIQSQEILQQPIKYFRNENRKIKRPQSAINKQINSFKLQEKDQDDDDLIELQENELNINQIDDQQNIWIYEDDEDRQQQNENNDDQEQSLDFDKMQFIKTEFR